MTKTHINALMLTTHNLQYKGDNLVIKIHKYKYIIFHEVYFTNL